MIRNCTIAALASALLGCAALTPQPDRTRYFVLTPVAATRPPSSFDHALGIGPVNMPDHLENQLVTRVAEDEIDISDNDRWGESLRDSFGQVIRQNLVVLLGTQRIMIYPYDLSSPPEVSVSIDLLRFERTTSGTVDLWARWTIARWPDRTPVVIRESSITKPLRGTDTRAAVSALSDAVYDLSGQIATDVRRVPLPQARQ